MPPLSMRVLPHVDYEHRFRPPEPGWIAEGMTWDAASLVVENWCQHVLKIASIPTSAPDETHDVLGALVDHIAPIGRTHPWWANAAVAAVLTSPYLKCKADYVESRDGYNRQRAWTWEVSPSWVSGPKPDKDYAIDPCLQAVLRLPLPYLALAPKYGAGFKTATDALRVFGEAIDQLGTADVAALFAGPKTCETSSGDVSV